MSWSHCVKGDIKSSIYIMCAFVRCVHRAFVQSAFSLITAAPLLGEVIYTLFFSTRSFGKFEISSLCFLALQLNIINSFIVLFSSAMPLCLLGIYHLPTVF